MEVKEVEKLIDKYLSGIADSGEKEWVENWYNEVNTKSDQPDEVSIRQYKEETWTFLQAAIAREMAPDTQAMPSRGKYLLLYKWLAAAVLLLSMATAFYFYQHQHQPAQQFADHKPQLKNDALPGGNKAVLTLSNGRKIVLTSAANGLVAKQAGIIIDKTEDGRLAYQLSPNINQAPDNELSYNIISTPRGGNYHLTLEDGTQVWLNSASSLKYPVIFKGSERLVELTGEGYFEVAKNKTRPFKVNVAGQTVEVLGTHFNINGYSNEPAVKTTLLEGSVNVSAGEHSIVLKPGQQALYSPLANGLKIADKVNIDEVMAWRNGKFLLVGADIKTVMRQLERWYDVDAVYGRNIPTDHFNGKIPKNINLSQVLQVLKNSGVDFKIEGKKIIIK